jgi:hypothetical protein
MHPTDSAPRPPGRREFLGHLSAAAVAAAAGLGPTAAAAQPATPLPAITLGRHRVSRLIAGWNPIGGHSHTTLDMARAMREWFTEDRLVEFLLACERHGITAWQYDYTDKAVAALRRARERGARLQVICLHAERPYDAPLRTVLADTAPIAVAHHGGVTDALFRAGQMRRVRDFVRRVKDHGLLAGVSSHCPDHVRRMADAGWENDFFMTCFYYVNRTAEEQRRLLGRVTVGEPFFESDPADMTAVMRAVGKPCLGFKILAAGRSCWSPPAVEQAFRAAFASIKRTDGVIVGMFPRYADQVAEDAALARRFGAVAP